MTARSRRDTVLCALGLAICLVAAKPPRVVGDGGEYIVLARNFANFNGPSLARRDLEPLKREVLDYAPEINDGTFYATTATARDGSRDFLHFWFYSLAAAPFVGLIGALGAPAVYGFAALNIAMILGALWVALPRLGPGASALVFLSPIVWWLDKPHTEVFTFSLLTLLVLLAGEAPWWAMIAAGAASTQYPPLAPFVAITGLVAVAGNRAWLRDRRFYFGAAAGLLLALLHPAYYYARHGTPSLLLATANTGTPTWAEVSAVLIDPIIGLAPNAPLIVVAGAAGAIALLRQRARDLFAVDVGVSRPPGGLPAVGLRRQGQRSPRRHAQPQPVRLVVYSLDDPVPSPRPAARSGLATFRGRRGRGLGDRIGRRLPSRRLPERT